MHRLIPSSRRATSGSRLSRLRERLEPSAHGLPSGLALTWFPVLVLLAFVLLVALNLNGSSSGEEWGWFNGGSDPGKVLGQSRPVRSDEWFVQLTWTISQYHQGFPPVNQSLPGGTDLTTLYDVPTGYWTVIFRPQLWGYFFLGLSHGLAWHWWLPPALTAIAAYLLVVTINPRRPLTAAALAVATVICPMTLWWWQTSVFLSVGWPLFVMAATIWIVRHPHRWVRLAWIALSAFFAVTLALTSYIPFILSGAWVCVIFAVGVVVEEIRGRGTARRVVLGRAAGLIAAGGVAAVTVGAYAFLRRDSLRAIAETVYPGQRSDPTGLLSGNGEGTAALFGAPFNGALRSIQGATPLGPNQSESSATFMVAVFLVPGLVLLVIAARRASGRWSAIAIGALAAVGLYLAYLFVAHWDLGARLLLLDKVPSGRARLAFAALLPLLAAITIALVDRLPAVPRRVAAAVTAITVVGINVAVWRGLRGDLPNVLAADGMWRVAVVALCAGTVALFFRRLVLPGAIALIVATSVVSAGIVPLHRGVVDLYESSPGKAVRAIDDAEPGTWVGTRFPITTALLVQSGVASLNAVQSYPSLPLWEDLDPTSAREDNWNRYAHLDWVVGTDDRTIEQLVAPDHLIISMDPCSDFAQREVDYVLTPTTDVPESPCLETVRTIDTPSIDLEVMRVVPADPASVDSPAS